MAWLRKGQAEPVHGSAALASHTGDCQAYWPTWQETVLCTMMPSGFSCTRAVKWLEQK